MKYMGKFDMEDDTTTIAPFSQVKFMKARCVNIWDGPTEVEDLKAFAERIEKLWDCID